MNRIKIIASLLMLGLSFLGFSQVKERHYYADEGLLPRAHVVDMQHLKLDLSIFPEEKKLQGKVEQTFICLQKTVDSLQLDAVNMNILKVELDGKEVKFKNDGTFLTLFFSTSLVWNETHKINISYEAFPKKGIYFIGWDDPSNVCRKQIWTQGQGINNRHWIPMYDEKNDKFTSEVMLEFDEKFKVLSNGKKLAEKAAKDGKKFWHYKMSKAHASYLIMLGIGEYGIDQRKSKSGVAMNLYYYPDQKNQLKPTYKFSEEMFNFFEKEIGVPFPWENYAQIPVQDFMYGAMENTTATIFGDFYLVDSRSYLDKNYVRVNAHELAHQWFGDMVTARASAHHWLQESFATHYDMMYQKEAFGSDHFDWVRRDYNNQAIEASKADLKPLAHSEAGTVRHYPKGAFVLQMLKDVVGREQYNAAIKYYLEKHAYGNVDSKDLLLAFHERLGLSLNWFWEEWVYKGGEPSFLVDYWEEQNNAVFSVKQVQEQNNLVGLFDMPISFEIHFSDGSMQSELVRIAQESQLVKLPIPEGKKVEFALFDPNNRVMKSVSFKKSIEQLKAQAEKASHMLDRFDAIQAFREIEFEGKEDFLMQRFIAESFHGIKAEIISQILPLLNQNSLQLAELGLNDADVEVRKSILKNTFRIPEQLLPNYEKLLTDSSYQVIEEALTILGFYYPQNLDKYLTLTAAEMGNRSHNVRIKNLELQIAKNQDEEAYNELVNYTSNSHEFLTRVKAAKALKTLNLLDELALGNLLQATFSFNSRLKGPVVEVLDFFFEQDQYKRMMVDYVSNRTWAKSEYKKISKYLRP